MTMWNWMGVQGNQETRSKAHAPLWEQGTDVPSESFLSFGPGGQEGITGGVLHGKQALDCLEGTRYPASLLYFQILRV